MKLRSDFANFAQTVLILIAMSFTGMHVHALETYDHCSRNAMDLTGGLKAYLMLLLEKDLIQIESLHRMKTGLKEGTLINPIAEAQTHSNPILFLHRNGLEEDYLSSGKKNSIDQKELLSWLEQTLAQLEVGQELRNQTQETTQPIHHLMDFNEIPPGEYFTGPHGFERDQLVKIKHTFTMMDAHVTQRQWAEVMGENPAHFGKTAGSKPVDIHGKTIQMQADHPIENITLWSALVFANRLSIKHGLKPVYNLTGIPFKKGTRAEDGSLAVDINSVIFPSLSPTQSYVHLLLMGIFSKARLYKAAGYRLPTQEEIEYVMTNLGKDTSDSYIFGKTESGLMEYAWVKENSGTGNHPVAEKKPFMIDGLPFYDLDGNAKIWTSTYYRSGKIYFHTAGRSWNDELGWPRPHAFSIEEPNTHRSGIGLKLVRTSK